MEFPKIIYKGQLCDYSALLSRGERLLSELYLYQNLRIHSHKALHLERHLEIITSNYKSLFGSDSQVLDEDISLMIQQLLDANNCKTADYCVVLRVWRDAYMLSIKSVMLYSEYTLWHTRESARLITCENPITSVCSSVSLSLTEYAMGEQGSVMLCANLDGVITGVGDLPVFCVSDSKVYTTPLSHGASLSVEREMVIRAIREAGYELIHRPVLSDRLVDFDEVFYANTQGLVSIRNYGDKIYFQSLAKLLVTSF